MEQVVLHSVCGACRLMPGGVGSGAPAAEQGLPRELLLHNQRPKCGGLKLQLSFIFISNLLPGETDLCWSPRNKVRGQAFSERARGVRHFQENHSL